ncbi:hypothetical protein CEXT_254541 [Caerostris extrusa]|uniref:Uncharacterized protein n=1 Tax=Caerostris extrusa TaxID=172846 RepID=A0AAV4STF7_CAEEX|nr:hypothetical protein CEXT_254541 [Caerostris extrusa]
MITNFPLAAVNGGSKSSLASEDLFLSGEWQQYRRQTIFKQCVIPGGLLLAHPSETKGVDNGLFVNLSWEQRKLFNPHAVLIQTERVILLDIIIRQQF